MFEEEEVVLEEVMFTHEILREKHRKHRKANRKHFRTDRYNLSKYPWADTKFCKRNLHKFNRRHPEEAGSNYYKNGWNLASVSFGLT